MRVAPLALLAILAAPERAEASFPNLFTFGARASAMAGTLTAAASGYEAVYYNPGALAVERRSQVSFGFHLASFSLALNGEDHDVESVPAATIGLVMPLPFRGPLADMLTLGFGFLLPQKSVLTADIPRPGVARFVRVGAGGRTVSLMGGIGVAILDELSVGAAVLALAELGGAIDVAPSAATGRIGARVTDELLADFSLMAGVSWRPTRGLSLGLVFRDESSADFRVEINAQLGDMFPLPVPLLDVAGTAQYDPRQLGLAATTAVAGDLTASLGVLYQQWSRFKNPIRYTAVPSNYPEQPEPGFSDVVLVSAGLEWPLALGGGEWRLIPRAGGAFEPSPAPEQTGLHAYLDNTRIIGAAGLGLRYSSFRLDAAAQLQVLPERRHARDTSTLPDQPGVVRRQDLRHGGAVGVFGVEVGVEL